MVQGRFDLDQNQAPSGRARRRVRAGVGMIPMPAIQAGTIGAARLLRWKDRVGPLRAGNLADIIAVPGDALADLHRAMRSVG